MAHHESSGVLERLGLKPEASDQEIENYQDDAPYQAFGLHRQSWGGPPLLNFVLKTGQQRGLPYSQIVDSSLEPGDVIRLEFYGKRVTIRGRRLSEAYAKLLSFRVVYFAEADHATARLVPENEPVITEIRIADNSPGLLSAEPG